MKKIEKTILLTGGFDPLHSGHIALINHAKSHCKHLTIGLNSDEWLKRKKGSYFMPFEEREEILSNLEAVNIILSFNDSNNSANDAISKSLNFAERVIFANGGDRNKTNIPEYDEFKSNKKIEFIYDVGGSNKKNSSSLILKNFLEHYATYSKNKPFIGSKKTKPWGFYEILIDANGYKLKRITVKPNQRLSLQYHKMRSEHWIIAKGDALVLINQDEIIKSVNDHIFIPVNSNHRIKNIGNDDLIFIEVSFGKYLGEDDIVRIDDDYSRTNIDSHD